MSFIQFAYSCSDSIAHSFPAYMKFSFFKPSCCTYICFFFHGFLNSVSFHWECEVVLSRLLSPKCTHASAWCINEEQWPKTKDNHIRIHCVCHEICLVHNNGTKMIMISKSRKLPRNAENNNAPSWKEQKKKMSIARFFAACISVPVLIFITSRVCCKKQFFFIRISTIIQISITKSHAADSSTEKKKTVWKCARNWNY